MVSEDTKEISRKEISWFRKPLMKYLAAKCHGFGSHWRNISRRNVIFLGVTAEISLEEMPWFLKLQTKYLPRKNLLRGNGMVSEAIDEISRDEISCFRKRLTKYLAMKCCSWINWRVITRELCLSEATDKILSEKFRYIWNKWREISFFLTRKPPNCSFVSKETDLWIYWLRRPEEMFVKILSSINRTSIYLHFAKYTEI